MRVLLSLCMGLLFLGWFDVAAAQPNRQRVSQALYAYYRRIARQTDQLRDQFAYITLLSAQSENLIDQTVLTNHGDLETVIVDQLYPSPIATGLPINFPLITNPFAYPQTSGNWAAYTIGYTDRYQDLRQQPVRRFVGAHTDPYIFHAILQAVQDDPEGYAYVNTIYVGSYNTPCQMCTYTLTDFHADLESALDHPVTIILSYETVYTTGPFGYDNSTFPPTSAPSTPVPAGFWPGDISYQKFLTKQYASSTHSHINTYRSAFLMGDGGEWVPGQYLRTPSFPAIWLAAIRQYIWWDDLAFIWPTFQQAMFGCLMTDTTFTAQSIFTDDFHRAISIVHYLNMLSFAISSQDPDLHDPQQYGTTWLQDALVNIPINGQTSVRPGQSQSIKTCVRVVGSLDVALGAFLGQETVLSELDGLYQPLLTNQICLCANSVVGPYPLCTDWSCVSQQCSPLNVVCINSPIATRLHFPTDDVFTDQDRTTIIQAIFDPLPPTPAPAPAPITIYSNCTCELAYGYIGGNIYPYQVSCDYDTTCSKCTPGWGIACTQTVYYPPQKTQDAPAASPYVQPLQPVNTALINNAAIPSTAFAASMTNWWVQPGGLSMHITRVAGAGYQYEVGCTGFSGSPLTLCASAGGAIGWGFIVAQHSFAQPVQETASVVVWLLMDRDRSQSAWYAQLLPTTTGLSGAIHGYSTWYTLSMAWTTTYPGRLSPGAYSLGPLGTVNYRGSGVWEQNGNVCNTAGVYQQVGLINGYLMQYVEDNAGSHVFILQPDQGFHLFEAALPAVLSSPFSVTTYDDSFCLAIQPGSRAVTLGACSGTLEQRFTYNHDTAQLIASNNLCVDGQGSSSDDNTPIVVAACDSSRASQQWWYAEYNNLWQNERAVGQVLDVPNAIYEAGAQLQYHTVNGGNAQLWLLSANNAATTDLPCGSAYYSSASYCCVSEQLYSVGSNQCSATAAPTTTTICPSGQNSCGSACYTPSAYCCVNGQLMQAGSSQCSATAAPASTSGGCSSGQQSCGSACYSSSSYCCVNNQLMQAGSSQCAKTSPPFQTSAPTSTTANQPCGNAWYNPSNYCCVNQQLYSSGSSQCAASSTPASTAPTTTAAATSSADKPCGNAYYNPASYCCVSGQLFSSGSSQCAPAATNAPSTTVSNQLCGNAYYNPASYCCVNGQLMQAGSSQCSSSNNTPAPTTAPPNKQCGNAWYNPSSYCCVSGQLYSSGSSQCAATASTQCGAGLTACGSACYDASKHLYYCASGQLSQCPSSGCPN